MATTPTIPPPPPGYSANDIVSAPPPPPGYSADDVVAATPSSSSAPSQDFTAAQLPTSGGIEIKPQASGIFDVAQRELDKFRQAIKDRTGNYSGQNTAANILTTPIDAPLRALSGALQSERSEGNRLEGSKEAVKGLADTVGLVSPVKSGVAAKALEAVNAESALNLGSDILRNAKTLAKQTVANYKPIPVPDIGTVQAPLRDAVRSTANQLAQDHAVPLSPNTSLRDVFKNVGNSLQDKARVVYNALDTAISDATGGKVTRFQDFDKKIDEISDQMRKSFNDPDAMDVLEAQRDAIQKASDEAFFRAAREHGIDPALAEQANATYKQGKALNDVQSALNTHINEGRTELIPGAEAKFSIKAANNRLNRMYDTGRLQQALGDRAPQTLEDFHQAFTQETNLKDAAKQAAAHNARVTARKDKLLKYGAITVLGSEGIKKAVDLVK